jgi:hypothetical protein
VLVASVARQEPIEGGGQIGFGSRAHFHQGQSRRRMRHEHADEPVTTVGAKSLQLPGEVDDARSGSIESEFDRVHCSLFCRFLTGAVLGTQPPGYPFGLPRAPRVASAR